MPDANKPAVLQDPILNSAGKGGALNPRIRGGQSCHDGRVRVAEWVGVAVTEHNLPGCHLPEPGGATGGIAAVVRGQQPVTIQRGTPETNQFPFPRCPDITGQQELPARRGDLEYTAAVVACGSAAGQYLEYHLTTPSPGPAGSTGLRLCDGSHGLTDTGVCHRQGTGYSGHTRTVISIRVADDQVVDPGNRRLTKIRQQNAGRHVVACGIPPPVS